jgi:hypothetical protein
MEAYFSEQPDGKGYLGLNEEKPAGYAYSPSVDK